MENKKKKLPDITIKRQIFMPALCMPLWTVSQLLHWGKILHKNNNFYCIFQKIIKLYPFIKTELPSSVLLTIATISSVSGILCKHDLNQVHVLWHIRHSSCYLPIVLLSSKSIAAQIISLWGGEGGGFCWWFVHLISVFICGLGLFV